ncbi:hypothetical protein B296_00011127 [Ensete ventricosum]|uniref:Uncharacterized protein n=1 Tax=Ensete ventricosum TaxID=4639 RepID=A0A427AHG0_ENSVE|nr:hypothetical protein B296_00011127 [Ensete ventricosum]
MVRDATGGRKLTRETDKQKEWRSIVLQHMGVGREIGHRARWMSDTRQVTCAPHTARFDDVEAEATAATAINYSYPYSYSTSTSAA